MSTTTDSIIVVTCPPWCAEEHPDSGPYYNPRTEGYHRSVDMPSTYIFDNGEPAQWYISVDANDNGVPKATIFADIEDGLSVVDLRDFAGALLKMADELDRSTAR